METPEEEEKIPEVDIPEEEYEETDILGVDQYKEDPVVSNPTVSNNAMPENPPGLIPTNDSNTKSWRLPTTIPTPKKTKMKTKKQSKTRKVLSSKSTHLQPRNGAYRNCSEDTDYDHDSRQVSNTNT